jgi:hypothetical protein
VYSTPFLDQPLKWRSGGTVTGMFRILNAEGDAIHTISVLLRDILYERYLIETPSGMVNAIYYQFSLEIMT